MDLERKLLELQERNYKIRNHYYSKESQSTTCTKKEDTKIDTLEGHEFEIWCANLLKANSFSNVEVTPHSGDKGIDIIAEKEGIRYAIQCKRYSSKVGIDSVQEAFAGKTMYDCHIGVVMTNQYFTPAAEALADKTKILLWDRKKIDEMASRR